MSSGLDSSLDWRRFPMRTVGPKLELHRVHRSANGFAWFANNSVFRFDPPVSHTSKFGTCYFSYSPIGAFMETMGRAPFVDRATEIDIRVMTTTRLAQARRVADLTSRRAVGFGIDNSYSAGADYGPSQALAALLFDSGFAGIHYKIRHDPAGLINAVIVRV